MTLDPEISVRPTNGEINAFEIRGENTEMQAYEEGEREELDESK